MNSTAVLAKEQAIQFVRRDEYVVIKTMAGK
jgi:hypothetical protein